MDRKFFLMTGLEEEEEGRRSPTLHEDAASNPTTRATDILFVLLVARPGCLWEVHVMPIHELAREESLGSSA